MKKVVRIILTAVAAIVMAAIASALFVWGGEIRTLCSLERVGDNPYLYQMEYYAPYDLDDVIVNDIDSNQKLLNYIVSRITKGIPVSGLNVDTNAGGFGCTSFQARNAEGEGYLFGRNYDFFKNPTLVTVSRPKDGYASVACSDMSHFGYGLEKLPDSFKTKILSLASIYAPVDGMNEKGLCTSIMALPNQAACQQTGKHPVGTSIIMRLFLDRCVTVQEALDLVASYDIRHDAKVGSGYHYMVADASGACAVIEFDKNDGWKTMIVEKPKEMNHMLVTNHLLSPKYYTTEPDPEVGNPHSRSWWRYETAGGYLAAHDGVLTSDQAQECLALVHWKDLVWDNGTVEDTQFSNVYDQQALTLSLRSWYDYDTTCVFSLAR